MLSKILRGRFLELDEAARMIVWAVSKENSFMTGSVFDLSGGRATYSRRLTRAPARGGERWYTSLSRQNQ